MGDRHFTFHMDMFVLRSEAPFLCAYEAFCFCSALSARQQLHEQVLPADGVTS